MKKLILTLLCAATALVAAAQEYWVPSAELVERVRQEPMIKEHIQKFCDSRRKHDDDLKMISWEIQGNNILISQKVRFRGRNSYTVGNTLYVETNNSYMPDVWASLEKDHYTALSLCYEAHEGKYDHRPCDPWMTWLFYITGYTLIDTWVFNRPKKDNATIETTRKVLADAAMKMGRKQNWSRESQIAFLANYRFARTERYSYYNELQFESRYSDVKAMSTDGIDVCAGVLDRAQYEALSGSQADALSYIQADNPLVVIAARTLGLPLRIHLYDMTRFGTKSTITFQPASL